MVIMDEFQNLFSRAENPKIAEHCGRMASRITKEGRSFGIHLFMATQSTSVIGDMTTLDKGTIDQMGIRVGMRCPDSDARYLFGLDNEERSMEMMKGPIGTSVMMSNVIHNKLIGLRVAYCDPDTQSQLLSKIHAQYEGQGYPETIIFEGGRTTPLVGHLQHERIGLSDDPDVTLHLGSQIKIAPPVQLELNPDENHNLMMIGFDESKENNLMTEILLSACLNDTASVWCIDGDSLRRRPRHRNNQELYKTLAAFSPRFHTVSSDTEVLDVVDQLYDICFGGGSKVSQTEEGACVVVLRNTETSDLLMDMLSGMPIDESMYREPMEAAVMAADNTSGSSTADQLLGAFDDDDDPFASLMSSMDQMHSGSSGGRNAFGKNPSEKLVRMIQAGYNNDVYFVISTGDFNRIKDKMQMSGLWNNMKEWILFNLRDMDVQMLGIDISVEKMDEYTVLYSGNQGEFKLKPFTAPNAEELQYYLKSL